MYENIDNGLGTNQVKNHVYILCMEPRMSCYEILNSYFRIFSTNAHYVHTYWNVIKKVQVFLRLIEL